MAYARTGMGVITRLFSSELPATTASYGYIPAALTRKSVTHRPPSCCPCVTTPLITGYGGSKLNSDRQL